MAPLSYRQRKRLRSSSFAEPEKRAYPIENESHARNALSRVSRYGSSREKARVRAAVKRRYPHIGEKKDPPHDHHFPEHHDALSGFRMSLEAHHPVRSRDGAADFGIDLNERELGL